MKVAFVVQRYGTEILGGSESYCRHIAERLSRFYDVEVLTTCALDFTTWANHYPEASQVINGVTVRRFLTDGARDETRFPTLDWKVFNEPHGKQLEVTWNRTLGPFSTNLLEYIEHNESRYDCFIFLTYLYATTNFGLPLVKDRAILVPTAHDEPHIYLGIYDELMECAQYLVCLTEEELEFIQRRFPTLEKPVILAGINSAWKEETTAPDLKDDPAWLQFQEQLNGSPYLLYVGRIVEQKKCHELVRLFQKYREHYPESPLKLVQMGEVQMELPIEHNMILTGRVSDAVRDAALRNALALAMPSEQESLSLVLMESWMAGRPVVVNGRCAVLRGQCHRSEGGFWYTEPQEFVTALNKLVSDEELCLRMGENGRAYVQKNYQWSEVESRYCSVIETVARNAGRLAHA